MYGFEAIAHYNGWVMSVAGALIVFSGLAALSVVISQFRRLAVYLERKTGIGILTPEEKPGKRAAKSQKILIPDPFPLAADEAAIFYRQLADRIGQPFDLAHLYQRAAEDGFPHVHLSVKTLRESGILSSQEDGRFVLQ